MAADPRGRLFELMAFFCSPNVWGSPLSGGAHVALKSRTASRPSTEDADGGGGEGSGVSF